MHDYVHKQNVEPSMLIPPSFMGRSEPPAPGPIPPLVPFLSHSDPHPDSPSSVYAGAPTLGKHSPELPYGIAWLASWYCNPLVPMHAMSKLFLLSLSGTTSGCIYFVPALPPCCRMSAKQRWVLDQRSSLALTGAGDPEALKFWDKKSFDFGHRTTRDRFSGLVQVKRYNFLWILVRHWGDMDDERWGMFFTNIFPQVNLPEKDSNV